MAHLCAAAFVSIFFTLVLDAIHQWTGQQNGEVEEKQSKQTGRLIIQCVFFSLTACTYVTCVFILFISGFRVNFYAVFSPQLLVMMRGLPRF